MFADATPHFDPARDDNRLQRTADLHLGRVSTSVQYAFMMAKFAIDSRKLAKAKSKKEMLAVVEPALETLDTELRSILQRTLLEVMTSGGQVALNQLQTALLLKNAQARSEFPTDLTLDVSTFDSPGLRLVVTGGKGSGNFNHAGRPGQVGGSAEGIEADVYHGGVKEHSALVTYHTRNKKMAESYVDMSNDRFGSGGSLHRTKISIRRAAPESVVMEHAKKAGIDNELYTPASVFDSELHGADAVAKLVGSLTKAGYDGTELTDIGYGVQVEDKAIIQFHPEKLQKKQELSSKERWHKMTGLGGQGSGNFGHAGRPGQVGGSAEGDREYPPQPVKSMKFWARINDKKMVADPIGDSVSLYHVTSLDSARKINREGFKADHPNQFQGFKSEHAGVYGWSSLERARMEIQRASEHDPEFASDFAIIHLSVPKDQFHRMVPDEDQGVHTPWQDSYKDASAAITGNVPSGWIVDTYVSHKVAGKIKALAGKPPIRMSFKASDEDAAKWAAEHAADLAEGLTKTSRQAIKDAIEESVLTGSNPYDAIYDAIGDENRAELIARTETMIAVNEGQRQAWAQATDDGWLTGKEKRVWIATTGACPQCEELDGETASLDGMYPGGVDGPPLHPNCRCTEGIQG